MEPGAQLLLNVLAGLLFGLVPALLVSYAVFVVVTAPFRRRERARLFLDLLENGLQRGQNPEQTFAILGRCQDRAVGAPMRRLAARLAAGERLGAALEGLPKFLPRPMTAMLKAGEKIGDVGKVLPACRRMLPDGQSNARAGLNYMVVICLAVLPIVPALLVVLRFVVMPRYEGVFQTYGIGSNYHPAFVFPTWLMAWACLLGGVEFALMLVLYLCALAYEDAGWFPERLKRAVEAGLLRVLPWRRTRVQRDFSGMLAVLLDAGVGEEEAVRLAAASTADARFVRRAERLCQRLGEGLKLSEAAESLDNSGEFQWRLANAARGPGGFLGALSGWLESLDAKAFQKEQAGAQLATTSLVLLNGLTVAIAVVAIFLPLIELLNIAVLW